MAFSRFVPLAVALCLAASAWSVPSEAQSNPYDARQRELARDASRFGDQPEGVVAILELTRNASEADASLTATLLEQLSRDRRLSPPARVLATLGAARSQVRAGHLAEARDRVRATGTIGDFSVIGPFDNEGKRGFDQVFPPEESHGLGAVDPSTTYRGKEREVRWRPYLDASRFGATSLGAILRPNSNACAYALTTVVSERERALTLWAGSAGAFKAWWNGEEVLRDPLYRVEPDSHRHAREVHALEGPNRLLIKVCVEEGRFGFAARIGGADGGPPPADVRIEASSFPAVELPSGTARGAEAQTSPLDGASAFEKARARAEASDARAQAYETYARLLAYTGADDPAERIGKAMAMRAVELEPTPSRLALALLFVTERGERQRLAKIAADRFANDPQSLLVQAVVRRAGPLGEEALRILDRVPAGSRWSVEADRIRQEIWQDLGLVETRENAAKRSAESAPRAASRVLRYAAAAEAAGHVDLAAQLERRMLELQYDDVGTRRSVISDEIARGERNAVIAHLDALRELSPFSTSTLIFVAGTYEALEQTDEALSALQAARSIAPEAADVIGEHGELLLRLRQREAATEAFEQVLALEPQDADTRQLLEQIRPERREDEAYAVEESELLARRGPARGYPLTVLEDLTVNTVFESGLGSSFHQNAVEIHDTEGARQWRTYSIQFDPGVQRVSVRKARVLRGNRVLEAVRTWERELSEPWYRIYYDTRALTIILPDLEPGDVVNIQYRIDDIASRNRFADYYGDLAILQSTVPTRRVDYVLITPKSRSFFFNQPTLRRLRKEIVERGNQRIHHFHAENVPALRREPSMPGTTEVAPYLHVSTYGTWEDVGRWYWGLIKDQLQTDDSLRNTIRDLVRGAPDLRTKVQRIHNWVVRNTRYVGLEFGIHGFKPYRVPLIVQRGFGDCKDKASLLYTMFREAGIDARIVLVRTRRNGAIGDEPASLAVFDHAIAYVPELDLYLDGTAEHSGTTELPAGDQGVTVLVVGPESAELRTSPVLPPAQNQQTRRLDLHLASDGSAQISAEEEIRGGGAAGYRSTYAAEGTRRDRFETALRSILPGLSLESQTMEGLDNLESNITIRYSARAPQVARRTGRSLKLFPSVINDVLRRYGRAPGRHYPLELGAPQRYIEERTVHLAPGMRVSEVPEAATEESSFGAFRMTAAQEDRTVRIHTEFEIRRDRISVADYGAFRAWLERVDHALRREISISTEAP